MRPPCHHVAFRGLVLGRVRAGGDAAQAAREGARRLGLCRLAGRKARGRHGERRHLRLPRLRERRGAAAVVVMFHSWGATTPQLYGGWIEHLARRGNLVLFPRFQEVNRSKPSDATTLAGTLVREALAALADDQEARPDPKRIAYLGHVAGAAIALSLAAGAGQDGLPEPRLILAAMPGGITADPKARGIVLADLSAIPASTLRSP